MFFRLLFPLLFWLNNASAQTFDTLRFDLCPGERVLINQVFFDLQNPVGETVFPGGSWNGSDSVVIVLISPSAAAIGLLQTVLCSGESLLVNGNLYNEAKPSGTEIFPGATAHGCDSILEVTLTYLPEAVSFLNKTICATDSVKVGATVYHANRSSGTEILPGASMNGCDSTVHVTLTVSLLSADIVSWPPLCLDGNDGGLEFSGWQGTSPPLMFTVNEDIHPVASIFPDSTFGLSAGTYFFEMENGDGCLWTDTLFIADPPALTLELPNLITVALGDSICLTPALNFAPDTWTWQPPIPGDTVGSLSGCFLPLENFRSKLLVRDAHGCEVFSETNILIEKKLRVYVPNVFRPGTNPPNDRFGIYFDASVVLVEKFQVFDRWGELCFSKAEFLPGDENAFWTGFVNSKMAPCGIYTWFASLKFVDGERDIMTGSVLLDR